MKVKTFIKTTLLALALLLPCQSFAKNQDLQSWNSVTLIGPIAGKFKYSFDIQQRIGMDVSKLSQSFIGPGIGYQLTPHSSIWLAYTWLYTYQPFTNRVTNEHRLWQQYLWIKNYHWIKVISRSRLEQQFIDRQSSVGWRYRQFARLQLPFKSTPNYFFSTSNEVFIRLKNTASVGSNRGFDQNRFFIGGGSLAIKNWLIEVGYMHNIINRNNAANFHGHYITVNLLGIFS